ncbi:hypothetical protein MRX96_027943 [Rhipicephalus microplus]
MALHMLLRLSAPASIILGISVVALCWPKPIGARSPNESTEGARDVSGRRRHPRAPSPEEKRVAAIGSKRTSSRSLSLGRGAVQTNRTPGVRSYILT